MITQQELAKLQKLSKISLSQEELNSFTQKLNNVMEMIDSLKNLNCQDVEPMRSISDGQQSMREDIVEVTNINEQLFSNVPLKNADFAREVKCFIVPKMIE